MPMSNNMSKKSQSVGIINFNILVKIKKVSQGNPSHFEKSKGQRSSRKAKHHGIFMLSCFM